MSTRARIGKVLRRWADRIDGSDMIPTMIKVPPGTLAQIRRTPAKPSPDFRAAVDRARERQATNKPVRRPPAGGAGEAKAR